LVTTGPDGYPVYETDPHQDLQQMLGVYLSEILQKHKTLFKTEVNPTEYATGVTLMGVKTEVRAKLVEAITARLYWVESQANNSSRYAYRKMLTTFVRRNLELSESKLEAMCYWLVEVYSPEIFPLRGFIRQLEWRASRMPISPNLAKAIATLKDSLEHRHQDEYIALKDRLRKLSVV
jgi:hypothetical protein